MSTTLTTYRPSLLGSRVFDDVFTNFFGTDFQSHLRRSTQGYPVADIYREENGSTVMEFALAGFTREELTVDVQPDKRSITVSAVSNSDEVNDSSRRIARRGFQKTYVNYDNNLDLNEATAEFENGLLRLVVPQRPETKPLAIEIK